MNTTLSPLPPAAPTQPADRCSRPDPAEEGESFASLLDDQTKAGKQSVEAPEPTVVDAESPDEEASNVVPIEDEATQDDQPVAISPFAVQLPALPCFALAPLHFPLPEITVPTPVDGELEGGAEPARIEQARAETAGTISAQDRPDLPLLSAMYPVSMAQLQAQLGHPEHGMRNVDIRPRAMAQTPVPSRQVQPALTPAPISSAARPIEAPLLQAGAVSVAEASDLPAAAASVEFDGHGVEGLAPIASTAPTRRFREAAQIVAPTEFTPTTEVAPTLPQSQPVVIASAPETPVSPEEPLARATPMASPNAASTTVANTAPRPRGTSAAKRGEVMQNATLELPVTVRQANSAEVADGAPQRGMATTQPIAFSATTDGAIRTQVVAPTSHAERGEREPSREFAPEQGRAEIAVAQPVSVPPTAAGFETHEPESVAADAPITRTELSNAVERTTEAAVRMRAAGTERLEIAVRLESGDHLTIQLHLANGEVAPTFRTNSEALRTALEQNWSQFSEHASDRGVRMTPPVFDVNSSTSNMTDLSQQRHGREHAHADPQAELFQNLPRRVPAPRVLPASAVETAPAAGVRLYA